MVDRSADYAKQAKSESWFVLDDLPTSYYLRLLEDLFEI